MRRRGRYSSGPQRVLKAKQAGANFTWQLAIQYAAVRVDEPDAPSTLGNAAAGSGEIPTGDISVSGTTPSKRFFRLGIAYSSSSGVTQADVSLVASWKSVATPLAARRVTLAVADLGTKYEVLTDWMPATFMSKVKAVFMLNSITGASSQLRYRLAVQTAVSSVQQPGTWTDLEAGWTTPSGTYSERNTGELTVSTTTEMWFRLGVAYGMTSTIDSNVTAVLDAICSCR